MPPSTPSTLCTLCNHPDRAALDAALDKGVSLSEIARRAGTSRTSVRRHQAHRGAKPEGPPAEADAVHAEAEPASSPLPPSARPAPPAPPPAAPLPPSVREPAPLPGNVGAVSARADQSAPGKVIAFPGARARPGPGRRCACCSSEHRQAIDAAIGAGMSYRGIERRYGVSDDSARHHATECVPEALARAADGRAAAEAQTVDTVLEEVTRLLTEARDALAAATADGEASHKDRATWFRELRQTVELLAKLRGELITTTNNYLQVFLQSKDWERVRTALVRAILPEGGNIYEPVTRDRIMTDVVAALRALDA